MNFIKNLKNSILEEINFLNFSKMEESQIMLTKNDLQYINPEDLSPDEIKVLVKKKMDLLSQKNPKKLLIKKYLKKVHIKAFIKFQRRIRSLILKKKFFQAIKMNHIIEQKSNYLILKRNIENFDNEIIMKKSKNNYIYVQQYKNITKFRRKFFNSNTSSFEKGVSYE